MWPLPERFAWKSIFGINPLHTIPLLISLIFVFRTDINLLRKKYVWLGIIISSCYLLLTVGLKLMALQKFESALKNQKTSYKVIIVKTMAFNTIFLKANVATSDGYLLAYFSFFEKAVQFKNYNSDKMA